MVVEEVLEDTKELLHQTTAGTQRASDVRSCQVDRCIHTVLFEDPDVSFEVLIYENKILNGDIEDIDVPYGMVIIVGELGAGLHHIVHGDREFPGDRIGGLLLFAGLLLEIVLPDAEHLVVMIDQSMCAHVKSLVKRLASATHDRACHLAGADLETWVEAAVGGQSLGIAEASRGYDPCKPDDGRKFSDLGSGGEYADHLLPREGSGIGFLFHGTGFLEDPCLTFFGLCGKTVEFLVFVT